MSITRHETGPRMSQVVIHGNTVYLAGVVAHNEANQSIARTPIASARFAFCEPLYHAARASLRAN